MAKASAIGNRRNFDPVPESAHRCAQKIAALESSRTAPEHFRQFSHPALNESTQPPNGTSVSSVILVVIYALPPDTWRAAALLESLVPTVSLPPGHRGPVSFRAGGDGPSPLRGLGAARESALGR